ncbi:hypothetical protein [uncultured Ellagibacter sp.]|uniref:hypothetical protein n=1 Tax=uncultured Ellagibacter sp. TaxID=2137580 RepID=UPI0026303A4E|nr:hypothetical protein [uncultured Ellagibacter sp.]
MTEKIVASGFIFGRRNSYRLRSAKGMPLADRPLAIGPAITRGRTLVESSRRAHKSK